MTLDGQAGGGDAVFRICTLVTRWPQYEQMKASFLAAGFDAERCRYATFDNSAGNQFEPYSLINRLIEQTAEPYLIVCHQDVLLDHGHGFDQLLRVLQELDQTAPNWAVAGNAGCTDDYDWVLRLDDPNGFDHWPGPFPVAVHNLDENFLVIRRGTRARCSADLSGFHLYATDLCLHARLEGETCHVVDFYLTHLSAGNFGQDFWASRRRFIQRWNPHFNFLYIIRGAEIFLSRWKLFHRIFPRVRPRRVLRSYRPLRRLMTIELSTRRGAGKP